MALRDAIDNFYEQLVAEAIDETSVDGDDPDYLTDVMCVALNRLPAKYYRHSIDMSFYMAEGELETMRQSALAAVKSARDFVKKHQRE